MGRLDDGVDTQHQRGRDEQRADHVGSLAQPDPAVGLQEPRRQHHGSRANGEIDQEYPVPADRLGDEPAGQQADRAAGRRNEAKDADCSCPLPGLREHRDDHPKDHSRARCATDPLPEPGDDQHRLADRGAAEQRGRREQGEPAQEDALAADQVAEPPGQQHEAAVGDQVGIHHPREAGLREAEVALDRRERHVDDGLVEDDHQKPGAEDEQRQPARAGRLDRRRYAKV